VTTPQAGSPQRSAVPATERDALQRALTAIPFRRMMRVTLAVALAALALFFVHAATWLPKQTAGAAPADGFSRVNGVIHVHTTHSDGGGTTEEVVQVATRAGLDFVVVTDHNNLDAKSQEGYHGRLLLLVGTEISTTSGYLLGLGAADPAYRFSGDALDALDDIRQLGGYAFAAHPTSPREEFTWRGWDLPGAWGLEVVNLDCQWREASAARLARAVLTYPVNARLALLGLLTRPASVLRNWDAQLAKRDVPALAGADAHSRIALTKKKALRLPSYASLFDIARSFVLLDKPPSGEAAPDGAAILSALAKGRSYTGLQALAPAGGFFFEAFATERHWTMGDTAPADVATRLRVGGRLPPRTRLVLLRDGQELQRGVGSLELATPGPGVYRVEAYVPGWSMPWIISNPIYVFDGQQAAARAARGLAPSDSASPSLTSLIDDFEGRTAFGPEADVSSSMGRDILDSVSPWQGLSSGRMSFRLGDGGGHQSASCALVSREKRDWSGKSGLLFAIKGDGEYRVHVQIRDENPKARDGGAETWFASAKSAQAWRRVAIPFTFFRSTDPKTDGRLDLDRIRLVAFVVDKGAEKIGTQGTIWLDEIGLY
jgi:hypothetical protein